jgi:hypothetical protein
VPRCSPQSGTPDISTITRPSREKLLFFDGCRGKKFGRRFLVVTLFMEGHVRFVDLKVLNDERAFTIVSSLVAVVSTLAGRNYIITAVCTDNASNDVSRLNELHALSLPRQARVSIIRILCGAQAANLALCDFLTESKRTKLCDIRRILAVIPGYTGAPFRDIPRPREEHWFSLGKLPIIL